MGRVDRVTVWDDRLGPGERAALEPGVPGDLDHAPDVLVVGGGAVGLAVAVACRRAGLGRVVVLEQAGRLAASASGGNGGAIAPDMHVLTDSAEFVAFGRASRELYRDLDAEWDGAIGLWPTRWLNIFPAGAAPQAMSRSGFPLLDAAAVRDLEPDVRLPEGGTALLVDGQLGVNPQRLVAAFAARCGQVAAGVRMRDITVRGDRVVAVHTSAGDFAPGVVVLATGLVPAPWDAGVPQRWIKGHMLAVAAGPWRLSSVLAGAPGGGAPLRDGTVVCGGTLDEGDLTPDVRPAVVEAMAADLATVLPAAAGAAVTHRWCCFRPYVEGRQPVVDRLPGTVNGWFAGGHFTTGIMMAAATGAATAEWIAGSTTPELVGTLTLPTRR
jgi:glycine/D-amino acid oxidase-like deaminating enzyme